MLMKKYNNYDLHFVFESKEGVRFANVEYIHPLKQKIVNEYVKQFEQDANVKAAIIFGSSVEFRCNSRSDVDICIERYDREKGFRNHPELSLTEETDIVYADSVAGRLKSEIEQKGIVVFDREGIYV
jgi:predicted nucleotidyltransferase